MNDAYDGTRLSRSSAFWLAGLVSTLYVVAVYLSHVIAHPRPPLWRNEPKVIQARSFTATLSTLCSFMVVYAAIKSISPAESDILYLTLKHLGITQSLSELSIDSLRPHFIIPILFLGPLYTTYLDGGFPFQRQWDFLSRLNSWEGFRNYIMAPITEEITYRSCVLSLFQLAGYSRKVMIWATPCWFGLAHLHHAYESYTRLGMTDNALRTAVFTTIFQFTYTTVFGWLCSFLFLRTGSIFVPIVAHMFCNIMGFPLLLSDIKRYPSYKTPILVIYVLGAICFICALYPLSRSPESMYWTNS